MNQKRKLKFIHITKTAGTTIEELARSRGILWGRFDHDLRQLEGRFLCGSAFWHTPLRFLEENALQELQRNFDFFAVVRDPYERVISECYCPWAGLHPETDSRESFNAEICKQLLRLKQRIRDNEHPPGHWTPQHYYVYDERGERMVQHVIRFENLVAEFAALMERYGLDISIDTCHNAGRSKQYSVSELSGNNIRLINEIYAGDFKRFGYMQT